MALSSISFSEPYRLWFGYHIPYGPSRGTFYDFALSPPNDSDNNGMTDARDHSLAEAYSPYIRLEYIVDEEVTETFRDQDVNAEISRKAGEDQYLGI